MKEPITRCAIFVAGAIAGALINSILDEPLRKVRQTVFSPSWSYICGTDDQYQEGAEILRSALKLATDPEVEKTAGLKARLDEMHANAMESMEHAAWCGSKDAIKIIAQAHCNGYWGYPQDRQAGLALIRSELTPEHEMPSQATIQQICPLGNG